jgi:hypothetical protein
MAIVIVGAAHSAEAEVDLADSVTETSGSTEPLDTFQYPHFDVRDEGLQGNLMTDLSNSLRSEVSLLSRADVDFATSSSTLAVDVTVHERLGIRSVVSDGVHGAWQRRNATQRNATQRNATQTHD